MKTCLAHWCVRPVQDGAPLCREHMLVLTPESQSLARAWLAGALAQVAAAQMRRAFESLPEETRGKMRRVARDL